MCVAALSAVVGIAQAAVSFAAAQADYEAKAEQWKQNYSNALASGRDEQKQLQLRMIQEDQAHHQKQRANIVEGAEVAAEAEVSAGNAGLSGISLDNILLGIRRKIWDKQTADETNYQNTAQQLEVENKATFQSMMGRINSVQRPVAPNPLGYALQGIGGALGAFS